MSRKNLPQQTRKQKFSNWIILIAIALMGLATYWVVKNNYYSAVKSPDIKSTEQYVELHAFYHANSKSYQGETLTQGEELVFKMSSTFPAHVSLILFDDNTSPRIVYSGARIAPGQNHLIEIADKPFVYTANSQGEKKICLLAATSEDELKLLLSAVQQGRADQLSTHCVKIISN